MCRALPDSRTMLLQIADGETPCSALPSALCFFLPHRSLFDFEFWAHRLSFAQCPACKVKLDCDLFSILIQRQQGSLVHKMCGFLLSVPQTDVSSGGLRGVMSVDVAGTRKMFSQSCASTAA